MLLSNLLLPFALLTPLTPAGDEASLLAAVPSDAYALGHCRNVAALRGRAERNDWYRLLGSSEGEPLLRDLLDGLGHQTHSDVDGLLAVAQALEGEVVFFDTGSVAGFLTTPPANRAALSGVMRDWLPGGAARSKHELAGGTVELVAWLDAPGEPGGWTGRAGHFAAFVDHPHALALYSGDDSAAVLTALTEGFGGLGAGERAPLVSSYLASGGGRGGGIELFIDFTPLVDQAEATLKEAVEGFLPDPTNLLGLEQGTWLHANADVFAGTRIECGARLHLPTETLVARLADTFKPLPRTLPADLPTGVWGLWALNWDLKLFYERARTAYEEAGREDGLQTVDAGIDAAEGLVGIDPVVDVLNQLAGDFAVYFVEPAQEKRASRFGELEELLSLGVQVGLVDGDAFMTAFERLLEIPGLESTFQLEELAGVDVYVADEDDDFDGGLAILPRTLAVAPARRVLERSLKALLHVEGASLLTGSPMQGVIDENAGACFLWCVEMTPFRTFLLPELKGDVYLPALDDDGPARDPFDSQLIGSARRTQDGFEFRLHTR